MLPTSQHSENVTFSVQANQNSLTIYNPTEIFWLTVNNQSFHCTRIIFSKQYMMLVFPLVVFLVVAGSLV